MLCLRGAFVVVNRNVKLSSLQVGTHCDVTCLARTFRRITTQEFSYPWTSIVMTILQAGHQSPYNRCLLALLVLLPCRFTCRTLLSVMSTPQRWCNTILLKAIRRIPSVFRESCRPSKQLTITSRWRGYPFGQSNVMRPYLFTARIIGKKSRQYSVSPFFAYAYARAVCSRIWRSWTILFLHSTSDDSEGYIRVGGILRTSFLVCYAGYHAFGPPKLWRSHRGLSCSSTQRVEKGICYCASSRSPCWTGRTHGLLFFQQCCRRCKSSATGDPTQESHGPGLVCSLPISARVLSIELELKGCSSRWAAFCGYG